MQLGIAAQAAAKGCCKESSSERFAIPDGA
jgi:hypothetical protein